MKPHWKSRLIASASAVLLVPCAALAQDDAGDRGVAIEEVIVTAQKVESNLQQTPIAISAISADVLAARQINDVQGLMNSIPNVDFGNNLGTPRLAVRGIGFDNITVGNEARIAFHQDGVYFARPASTLSGFYDLERIEVLRGPQGALYGRNATGGAVNFITKSPTDTPEAYLKVNLGNYGMINTEAALSGPIAPRLTGRLALHTEKRDGYGRNEFTGAPVDDKETYAGRVKLKYEVTDDLTVGLSADYMKEDDHAYGYILFGPNPETNPLVPGAVSPRPITGTLFGGLVASRPRNVTTDSGPLTEREFYGVATDWNLRLGDYNLTAILSYRRSDILTFSDLDQTSAPIASIRQDESSDQYSVELRAQRSFQRGDFLVGAFYFKEKLEGGVRVPHNPRVTPTFSPINPAVACAGAPCTRAFLAPGYSQGFWQYGYLDTEAGAVFGNLYYRLTDQVGIRAGARYSSEKKSVDELTKTDFITPWPPYLDPFPSPTAGATYGRQTTSKTASAFTPSLTIDYRPMENVYLYASYSKGFKSGGFNLGNSQPAFAPEKISDYEVGLKADWLNGRLRTNLAAFYYDYTDIQLTRVQGVPPSIVVFNAPGAKLKGLEAEVTAIPFENARLELGYGFIDSEYSGPFAILDPARPWLGVLDLAGNQLTQAPRNTLNLAAEYSWLVPLGRLTLRGETQYKSRVFFSPFNLDYASQPAHWTSNAFLTFASEDEKFSASLWVRNIEDNLIRASGTVTASFYGAPLYGAYEPPRTYGIEVGYRY